MKNLAAILLVLMSAWVNAAEVNVYSARKESLIKPLLDDFTEKTGVEVNLVTGKADALLQRLVSEGRNTPADLLITTDAGRLYRAQTSDVLQAVHSDVLEKTIPENLRHPQGYWFGLSLRARPIMAVKGKVAPDALHTYEDLADPEWKGRICIRSSNNIYNQSLVASMLATQGMEKTTKWMEGFVKNFAQPPRGGDRDQIKAAAAGVCDIAIANTYYLGIMLNSNEPDQVAAGEKMQIIWPNQEDRGTHVNISGAAVTRYAKNKDAAIKLLEFMVSDEAQKWYASTNHEYPVKEGIEVSDTLAAWGTFKSDSVNMSKLGEYNAEAVMLMDRVGWK